MGQHFQLIFDGLARHEFLALPNEDRESIITPSLDVVEGAIRYTERLACDEGGPAPLLAGEFTRAFQPLLHTDTIRADPQPILAALSLFYGVFHAGQPQDQPYLPPEGSPWLGAEVDPSFWLLLEAQAVELALLDLAPEPAIDARLLASRWLSLLAEIKGLQDTQFRRFLRKANSQPGPHADIPGSAISRTLAKARNGERLDATDAETLKLFFSMYRSEVARARVAQARVQFLSLPAKMGFGQVLYVWHAAGLLPLLWVEIYRLIELGVKVKKCVVCGRAFATEKPNKKVCSDACGKVWRVERMGGAEALREYNRLRQRERRARLRQSKQKEE